MADIIDRFIQTLNETNGDPLEAEKRFRQQEGGLDGGYIRKNLQGRTPAARAQATQEQIATALSQGTPLQDAFAAAGASRE